MWSRMRAMTLRRSSRLHLHAPNPISVDELLNPAEENVLMEGGGTNEGFCRVGTNSENEARSELSSVVATGEDGKDAADSTPMPQNLSAEELKGRLKWMEELRDYLGESYLSATKTAVSVQSAVSRYLATLHLARDLNIGCSGESNVELGAGPASANTARMRTLHGHTKVQPWHTYTQRGKRANEERLGGIWPTSTRSRDKWRTPVVAQSDDIPPAQFWPSGHAQAKTEHKMRCSLLVCSSEACSKASAAKCAWRGKVVTCLESEHASIFEYGDHNTVALPPKRKKRSSTKKAFSCELAEKHLRPMRISIPQMLNSPRRVAYLRLYKTLSSTMGVHTCRTTTECTSLVPGSTSTPTTPLMGCSKPLHSAGRWTTTESQQSILKYAMLWTMAIRLSALAVGFGHNLTYGFLMCFLHVMKNVQAAIFFLLSLFPRVHKPLYYAKSMICTFATTEAAYLELRNTIVRRWLRDTGLIPFAKYMGRQWLTGPFTTWQAFPTPSGFATTNNPAETVNALLNPSQPQRLKMGSLLRELRACYMEQKIQ
ncbi:hypothetical protein GQ600_17086 [Phytophthora cactorum]|nr:hypothetical protein GQ600_17086 [Phytophthora cactorum]